MVPNIILKIGNEYRLVTAVDQNGNSVTIDKAFTSAIATASFEKIRFLTFDESSTTNNIILRTNEYFSALEYRIGDAIRILGH